MHECQIFRKDLTDLVLGANLFDPEGAFAAELKSCRDCTAFYRDALTVAHVMDEMDRVADQSFEDHAAGFALRLRENLGGEPAFEPVRTPPVRRMNWHRDWNRYYLRGSREGALTAVAGVIAVALVGALVYALTHWAGYPSAPSPTPSMVQSGSTVQSGSRVQIMDDHIAGLDSGTVAFIGKSELFLRDFTKIEPSDLVDLEDARVRARAQLTGIEDRRQAAATFPPVQAMLDEYELVLRDIKNVDEASGDEVVEIQSRIARNGLIASMKVYQPRVALVSSR